MLPSRAYSDPLPATATIPAAPTTESLPVLLLAVNAGDAERFNVSRFTRLLAHSTADVLRTLERTKPRIVTVDLDGPEFDAVAICNAAAQTGCTSVLASTASPERVPPVIKAGCHGVLLKPFSPAILASRLGRLMRDPLPTLAARHAAGVTVAGTNRTWPDTACPTCDQPGAVSFEFSSYRRMWYACLGCEAVWLGPRRE